MPDGGEAPICEYLPHGLIIVPGVDWAEWHGIWAGVERMQMSIQFWIGDALLAGQREFGEEFAQVVDEKYIFQQRGPMWVCSKIPLARRREGLSYSLHKVIAGLPTVEEQDYWLALAAPDRWSVKRLQEEMAAARTARTGSNGGPALAEPELPSDATGEPSDATEAGPGSTWNTASAEGPTGCADDALPGTADQWRAAAQEISRQLDVAEIRACIVTIRAIAPKLALNLADPEIHTLPARIAAALGAAELAPNPLFDVLAAVEIIPGEWRPSIRMKAGQKQLGSREWTAEVRRTGGLAVGAGPWLPAAILECALAAIISDLT